MLFLNIIRLRLNFQTATPPGALMLHTPNSLSLSHTHTMGLFQMELQCHMEFQTTKNLIGQYSNK